MSASDQPDGADPAVAGPDDATRRDSAVPWRIFLGIAVFMALIAALYWFLSYEDAGTVMLALSCGLALLFGGWLFLQDRRRQQSPRQASPAEAALQAEALAERPVEADQLYLPEASVWPFVMGLGALAALNGLILGWGYAMPGAVLLALALAGFIAQSRRRDLT